MRNNIVLLGIRRHRLADRFEPLSPMSLKVKTFGSPAEFKMLAKNMSMSGLMISAQNFRPLPFQVNTLLEISVGFNDSENEAQPLNVVGKVVRKFTKSGEQFLGVQIINTDEKALSQWCDFVAFVASNYGRKVS